MNLLFKELQINLQTTRNSFHLWTVTGSIFIGELSLNYTQKTVLAKHGLRLLCNHVYTFNVENTVKKN